MASGHRALNILYDAYAMHSAKIEPPAPGGRVELNSMSLGTMTFTLAGTYPLPTTVPKGPMLQVYAKANITLIDINDATVATAVSGQVLLLISEGDGLWSCFWAQDNPAVEVDLSGIEADIAALGLGAADLALDAAKLRSSIRMISLEELGCVPMYAVGGTSEQTATDNWEIISEYYAAGWKTTKKALFVPEGGWLINGTIEIPYYSGFSIFGLGGEPNGGVETEYYSEVAGVRKNGPISRLVAYDLNVGTLLRINGHGPLVDGVSFFGAWEPTNTFVWSTAGYPNPEPEDDLRCPVGIEITSNQNFQGTGKLLCPTFMCASLFGTGVKCVDQPQDTPNPSPPPDFLPENHADQCRFGGRFLAGGCTTGLHLENLQSVMHRIDHFDGVGCYRGVKIVRGGKIWLGQLDMQTDMEIGLEITGNDSQAVGHITVDILNIDATGEDDAIAVKVDPTTGGNANLITINALISNSERAAVDNPLFVLADANYTTLQINGGSMFQRMIKSTGGAGTFCPHIGLANMTTFRGEHPANTMTSDSSGVYELEYKSIKEGFRGLAALPLTGGDWVDSTGVFTKTGQVTGISNGQWCEVFADGANVPAVTGFVSASTANTVTVNPATKTGRLADLTTGASIQVVNCINGGRRFPDYAVRKNHSGTDIVLKDDSVGHRSLVNLSFASSDPSDGATNYWGNHASLALTSTAASRRYYVPTACKITACRLSFLTSGTLGSNDTGTVSIRVSNTYDVTVSAAVTLDVLNTTFANTALNINLGAGDYIEMKAVWPTFGTNPTGVLGSAVLELEAVGF